MKVSVFLSCGVLLGLLAGCGQPAAVSQPPETTPAPIVTPAPIETPASVDTPAPVETPEPTDEAVTRLIGIPGSYIKDIQIGVKNFGMTDDSASGAPEGAPYRWGADRMWTDSETGTAMDYAITGDDDSQLISGSFGTAWDGLADNSNFIDFSESYLGFISTMPYDTSDTETARQWVKDTISADMTDEESSTTIGDAVFTITATLTPDGLPMSIVLQISTTA